MRGVKALETHRWRAIPKAIAVLREGPVELTSRFAIRFQDDFDDLDALQQIYLEFPSGRVLVLRRHARDPVAGTTVYGERDDSTLIALQELREALSLGPSDFVWIAPESP